MKQSDYIPLPADRIAEALSLTPDQKPEFEEEIAQHLRQGTLVRLKKNRLCLPRDADLITGIIRFRQGGSAFLFAESGDGKRPNEAHQVRSEDTATSMHGDRVVCRIVDDPRQRARQRQANQNKNARDRRDEPQAKVIRILERANEIITGTLQRSHRFYYVVPGDPRLGYDILVDDPAQTNLPQKPKVDDKVVVKLLPWLHRHLNPEGEIIEVLGATFEPGAEYKALLRQYKLNPDFPAAVLDEVAKVSNVVPKAELKRRLDHRKVFTFTIDPQDAKDFDDALSVEILADGNFRIGVHIADVSAYVAPGTALDREAFERGNSTYLVGTVIPMLPHALSNGICSLVEDEDRLTKSVFLTIAPNGRLLGTDFANTCIRSNKRLTYEQAYGLLKEDDLAKIRAMPEPPKHQTGATGRPLNSLSDDELAVLQDHIRQLWNVASKMREKRMRDGSLDLDMPETKIFVDPEGYAEKLVKIVNDESHQLIEEFMLAANEGVAKALNHRRLPAVHRVHDEPEADKLDELSAYMSTVGLDAGDLTNKKHMTDLLRRIKAHPQSHTLRVMVLRSLKQAQYRASADGHYGLGKQHYLHFTSPIRRYADLVCHRIFDRYLVPEAQRPVESRRQDYDVGRLTAMAQHVSLTEQNSTEAERESNKIKLLEFFERELAKTPKNVFPAVIMDIRNHGMFVELTESLAYGFVHISTLHDDLYSVKNEGAQLVGRTNQRTFAIGDTIPVVVHRVDRFKRQIDFSVSDLGAKRTQDGNDRSREANRPRPGGTPPAQEAASGARKNRKRGGRRPDEAPTKRLETTAAAAPAAAQAPAQGGEKSGRRRKRSRGRGNQNPQATEATAHTSPSTSGGDNNNKQRPRRDAPAPDPRRNQQQPRREREQPPVDRRPAPTSAPAPVQETPAAAPQPAPTPVKTVKKRIARKTVSRLSKAKAKQAAPRPAPVKPAPAKAPVAEKAPAKKAAAKKKAPAPAPAKKAVAEKPAAKPAKKATKQAATPAKKAPAKKAPAKKVAAKKAAPAPDPTPAPAPLPDRETPKKPKNRRNQNRNPRL